MKNSLIHCYFDREYELSLEIRGEGTVSEGTLYPSLGEVFKRCRKELGAEPKEISLMIEDSLAAGFDYGFTAIDTAFLEKLEALRELILPDSITELDLTPKLSEIFKRNDTLIRGTFNSFAERFAAENGLRFCCSDCIIAKDFFEPAQESTVLSLIFSRDGSVILEEDVSSPGSSAGNTFGGKFYKELPGDFYMSMTAEDIADKYGRRLKAAILEDGRLAKFIEEAKQHNIYTGKN